MENEKQGQLEQSENMGHGYLGARFLWAIVGPIALVSSLAKIPSSNKIGSLWDVLCILSVGLMIVGRYVEQRSGHGTTLYGEASTWEDFRKYCVRLLILVVALVLLAKWSSH